MAVTQNTYTGNGSTVLYSFTFPYLATTDVKVKLNGSDTTAYSLANATTVQMNSAPANGDKIIIYRNTDNDNKKATFYPGSAIKAEDLNDNYDQILYTVQEVDNNAMSTLGDTAMQGDFLMGSGFGLQFEGATTDDFETRLIATDPTQDNVINLPNASGDLVTTESLTTGGIDTNDNVKIRFGTGNDLEIYHNGSNSYIDNTTGNLYFRGSDGQMLFRPNNNEDALVLKPNGAVELYFNNEKQIETTSLGAAISGSLGVGITTPTFGSGNGLHVRGATGGQTRIHLTTNYSGDTASDGFDIAALGAESGTSGGMINFIQHEAKSVKFQYGSENMIKMVPNGTVELYYDNSKKLHTDSFGVIVSGGLALDGDLTITSATPIINLTDTNNDSDYQIKNDNGAFNIKDVTHNDNRLSINSSGTVDVAGNLDVGAGLDVTGAITGTTNLTIGGASSIFAENNLRFKSSGAAYIDHNTTGQNINFRVSNSSSLDTTPLTIDSNGIDVTGKINLSDNLDMPDNAKVILGTGDDLKLYHDGTHSYLDNATGNLHIRGNGADDVKIQAKNGEQSIICHHDGAVELYFDNQLKAQTYASGWSTEHLTLTGNAYLADNKKIFLGDGDDLQIYHDGTNSYILDNGAGHLNLKTNGTQIILTKTPHANLAIFNVDGSNELYYDGTKKLETTSDGAKLYGHLKLDDNNQLRLGDATNGDFVLVHDATDSIINNTTGNLFYRSATHKLQALNGHDMLVGNTGGSVELYHNNSKKLETTSSGIEITGKLTFAGDGHTQGIELGADADIIFYHDNSNGYLDNNVGDLYLRNDGNSTSEKVILQAKGGEDSLIANANGNVELYYDGTKKLETTANGITMSGHIDLPDQKEVRIGGASLRLRHDGHSIIQNDESGACMFITSHETQFANTDLTEAQAKFFQDGAVELYYDGSKKLETTSYGVAFVDQAKFDNDTNAGRDVIWDPAGDQMRWTDNTSAAFGTHSDLKLYHDGANSYIDETGEGGLKIRVAGTPNNGFYKYASDEELATFQPDNAVRLFYDGVQKLATTSGGVSVTGNVDCDGIRMGDDDEIRLGVDDDLKIFHDTNNSKISHTGQGGLYIGADTFALQNGTHNENFIVMSDNGAVELYYAGNKKLETTTNGVTVTGSVTTQDINMSNLNASSGNEVDGTKGNWTMQEGESDLFLINRISGKKYKFNLTEIN